VLGDVVNKPHNSFCVLPVQVKRCFGGDSASATPVDTDATIQIHLLHLNGLLRSERSHSSHAQVKKKKEEKKEKESGHDLKCHAKVEEDARKVKVRRSAAGGGRGQGRLK
jgi:hypothetical protein